MKKHFAISLALLALVSCAKVENSTPDREISFRTANYLQTRAGEVAYTNGNFGVYSWYNGTDPFMENEEVGVVESVWTTIHHTYYWPKSGAITFLSYSPFSGTNGVSNSLPAISGSGSSWALAYGSASSPYTVADDDLMYADVVTCECEPTGVNDNGEAYHDAVPTLFHHALAKVRFEARASTLSEGREPDETNWEITIVKATVKGVYTRGYLNMNWNRSEWTKPAGNVWLGPAGASDKDFAENVVLTETFEPLGELGFVIPQGLDAQEISLDVKIKTTLPNKKEIEEDITLTAKLDEVSDIIKSWQMNQSILYRIVISPIDVMDPITFAPVTADWDEYTAEFTLPL